MIYECDVGVARERRVEALFAAARRDGLTDDVCEVRAALERAWRRHVELWEGGVASGAREITGWALAELAEAAAAPAPSETVVGRLAEELAEVALGAEIRPLEGARDTLVRLARAGVRRALICDTGMSPGRVVRRLLAAQGLLEQLEVTVFSDETGVPKPHPRVFRRALAALGLTGDAGSAVHVGDLRRTDVAGARDAGMRTVRIRGHHDDRSALPEADHVADSHAHLIEILGIA